jgi:hypothetical protein
MGQIRRIERALLHQIAVATTVRGCVIERRGHTVPEERQEYLTEQFLAFFG